MPRGKAKELVADLDQRLPDVVIPTTGDVSNISRPDLVTEVEPHRDIYGLNDYAKELAFGEEKIEIYLFDAANEHDELYVHCAVNGEPATPLTAWLRRGQNHVIKRKHAEVLLRARQTSYVQPKKHGTDEEINKLRVNRSMRYPFSIVNDPNPKGVDWFKRVSSQ